MSFSRRSGMYGVHAVVGRGQGVCPLVGGCLLVRVSIIGGSTVDHTSTAMETIPTGVWK